MADAYRIRTLTGPDKSIDHVMRSFARSHRRAAHLWGPGAVTVDAVTRAAHVARATLYRHFPSGDDLLAAAFNSLIPSAPMPVAEGSRRDRLVAVVLAQAESIAEAPAVVTAMSWLALGRDPDEMPEPRHTQTGDSAISTLRERIAQQYGAPFDVIFDSPAATELGEVDRSRAIALLIGPLVLGRLSTLPDFDYRECAYAAVDGFLYVQRSQNIRTTAASIESAGA